MTNCSLVNNPSTQWSLTGNGINVLQFNAAPENCCNYLEVTAMGNLAGAADVRCSLPTSGDPVERTFRELAEYAVCTGNRMISLAQHRWGSGPVANTTIDGIRRFITCNRSEETINSAGNVSSTEFTFGKSAPLFSDFTFEQLYGFQKSICVQNIEGYSQSAELIHAGNLSGGLTVQCQTSPGSTGFGLLNTLGDKVTCPVPSTEVTNVCYNYFIDPNWLANPIVNNPATIIPGDASKIVKHEFKKASSSTAPASLPSFPTSLAIALISALLLS